MIPLGLGGGAEAVLRVDRTALRDYADTCERAAVTLTERRTGLFSRAAGTTGDYRPTVWRDGIKVTLGTVDFDHRGRDAGLAMAQRIGQAGYAWVTAEEGLRALAVIARRVAGEFDDGDRLSARELREIAAEYLETPTPANLEHP